MPTTLLLAHPDLKTQRHLWFPIAFACLFGRLENDIHITRHTWVRSLWTDLSLAASASKIGLRFQIQTRPQSVPWPPVANLVPSGWTSILIRAWPSADTQDGFNSCIFLDLTLICFRHFSDFKDVFCKDVNLSNGGLGTHTRVRCL